MIIVRELDAFRPQGELLLTIGVFDGVHIGHRAVLNRLLTQRRHDSMVGALTFERHPQEFLHPGLAPKALTTVNEKINLLAGCGLDVLFLLAFDERIQSMSPEFFLKEVLLQKLRTKRLVVGERWRFGKDRAGDTALAARVLTSAACQFEATPLLEKGAEKVSSSRIRELLLARRFTDADELLGSPYTVRGVVAAGEGRGQTLGFPTANLTPAPEKLLPPPGVYAGIAHCDGCDFIAVASIGDKPTFGGGKPALEAHLLDFRGSIYGEQLALRDWRFLRDQVRYDGAEGLVLQMELDVAETRRALG